MTNAELERQREFGVDSHVLAMLEAEHHIVGRVARVLMKAARTLHEEGLAFNASCQGEGEPSDSDPSFAVDLGTSTVLALKSDLPVNPEEWWDEGLSSLSMTPVNAIRFRGTPHHSERERVEENDRWNEGTVRGDAEQVHQYWLARNKKDWLARNGWPVDELPPASKISGVYFIENAAGHVKVGRAKDPAKRLNDLQVGNSELLTLAHVAWFASAKEAKHCEAAVHVHLHNQRLHLRGEWFMKPTHDYADLVDKTEGIGQALDLGDCTFSPPVRRW